MKLVSIDIETTGLNEYTDDILEVGMVVYDMEKPFEKTASNSLRIICVQERLEGNIFALNMNAGIISEMLHYQKVIKDAGAWSPGYTVEFKDQTTVFAADMSHPDIKDSIREFVATFLKDNDAFYQEKTYRTPKITIAGKNFAMFDARFLREHEIFNEVIMKRARHRVYDVGTLYARPDDDVIPDLKTCCERAGLEDTTVTHYSVDDAVMVIRCIEQHTKTMLELTGSYL